MKFYTFLILFFLYSPHLFANKAVAVKALITPPKSAVVLLRENPKAHESFRPYVKAQTQGAGQYKLLKNRVLGTRKEGTENPKFYLFDAKVGKQKGGGAFEHEIALSGEGFTIKPSVLDSADDSFSGIFINQRLSTVASSKNSDYVFTLSSNKTIPNNLYLKSKSIRFRNIGEQESYLVEYFHNKNKPLFKFKLPNKKIDGSFNFLQGKIDLEWDKMPKSFTYKNKEPLKVVNFEVKPSGDNPTEGFVTLYVKDANEDYHKVVLEYYPKKVNLRNPDYTELPTEYAFKYKESSFENIGNSEQYTSGKISKSHPIPHIKSKQVTGLKKPSQQQLYLDSKGTGSIE